MTLTELQDEINQMVGRCEAAGIDARNMEVKIYVEHGVPVRITAERIYDDMSTTLSKRLA